MFRQHYSRPPYSFLHTDRQFDILSAEEEMPEQLGARLHLMSDDMGDQRVMIALPPGPRAYGRSPLATTAEFTIALGRKLGLPIPELLLAFGMPLSNNTKSARKVGDAFGHAYITVLGASGTSAN